MQLRPVLYQFVAQTITLVSYEKKNNIVTDQILSTATNK